MNMWTFVDTYIWGIVDAGFLLLALWSAYYCLSHAVRDWPHSKRRAALGLLAAVVPTLAVTYLGQYWIYRIF